MNIVVGLAIQLFLVLSYMGAPLAPVQNLALDRMMRINAALDPPPRARLAPPLQSFIDIDEAAWRDPAWGGGEPVRAPRAHLLALVARAFAEGAQQVVLDIAIEDEDAAFAAGLQQLLASGALKQGQLLVLVRSVRAPLAADGPGYLDELRAAPALDQLLAQGDARVVLAAPYFVYSPDRVLRDWQLFSVLCDRGSARVRILPSVQLVVNAHRLQLPQAALPWRRAGADPACTPFPAPGEVALPAAGNGAAAAAAGKAFWHALAAQLPARGIKLGAAAPREGALGNRVVYRASYPFDPSDAWFERISVDVLAHSAPGQMLAGRVVTIGQSFAEAGDVHVTPLGTMPGSAVLLNAIDSMARYGLVEATSPALALPLGVLAIVLVGYVFARLEGMAAKWASTAIILLLFALASVYLFRAGLWLDFALPLLGIQIYQSVRGYAERLDKLRRRVRPEGASHG
jgi:CHASE2 domain-containing sensor protein